MDTVVSKTLLRGETIQLLPFAPKDWEHIAKWFYMPECKNMFRQFHRILTEEEFKIYPALCNAEVFIIHSVTSGEVIGFIQAIIDSKKNKGCYIGMVLDPEVRGRHLPMETLLVFMEHLFNRQQYNKVIIEIVESDESLKKTLDSTGFYREGKLIQECFMDGKYINELRYSMTSYYYNKNKDRALEDYKKYLSTRK